MEAKQVKRLADIADIARMDLTPRAITLSPRPSGIMASYFGVYVAGAIHVTLPPIQIHSLTRTVSIAAAEFHDLVALFDDNMDVDLRPGDAALQLAAGRRRASLRYLPDNPPTASDPEIALYTAPADGTVRTETFVRDMRMALAITSDELTQPILTGIRLILTGAAFGIQTANGSSLVFQSASPAIVHNKVEVVLPSTDIARVLNLMRGETVDICTDGRAVILRSDAAVVKLPRMMGAWPKLSERLSQLRFDDHVQVPVPLIKAMAAAARAYKASGGDVILRPTEGGIMLETRDSELGQFQDVIPGTIQRSYAIDADNLDIAVKVAAEPEIEISFAQTMAMTKIGTRKLYIGLRVER